MEVNQISEDVKTSMRTRIISAIIMVAIGFPSILLGSWFYAAFILVCTGFIGYEILTVKRNTTKYSPFIWIFIYIMLYSIAFWTILKSNLSTLFSLANDGTLTWNNWWSFEGSFVSSEGIVSVYVSPIAIAILIFVLFFFEIVHANLNAGDVFYLVAMTLFIGLGIQCLVFLRYAPEGILTAAGSNHNWLSTSTLLFYVFLVPIMNDSGAYFVGVLFGKHKMNERISPKKTWEGFAGGIFFGMVSSVLFLFILSLCGYPVLPCFDVMGNAMNWINVVIISLVLPFIGTLGDFLFSAIKRYFEIKDFSNFIKGHGGFLDRFDSILSTAIIACILIIFMSNNWSFLK